MMIGKIFKAVGYVAIAIVAVFILLLLVPTSDNQKEIKMCLNEEGKQCFTEDEFSQAVDEVIAYEIKGRTCLSDEEFDEVLEMSVDEKINKDGMIYISEERYLELLDKYLWETVDKWKENGIIVTSEDKINEIVDEEVARVVAGLGSDEYIDYLGSDEHVQDTYKLMSPMMTKDQRFFAYCAGQLRFEDMHLNAHEKEAINEDMVKNMCKAAGR